MAKQKRIDKTKTIIFADDEYDELQRLRNWFREQYQIPNISMARAVILASRQAQKSYNIDLREEANEAPKPKTDAQTAKD